MAALDAGTEQPGTSRVEATREEGDSRRGYEVFLAKGMGVLSVGMGAAQLLVPGRVARLTGLRSGGGHMLMRGIGAREVGSGLGVLLRRRPAGFMWMRTGGDIMDLALVGRVMTVRRWPDFRLGATMAAVGSKALLDAFTSVQLIRRGRRPEERQGAERAAASGESPVLAGESPVLAAAARQGGDHKLVAKSITVNRPVEEVYGFWRDLTNLPRFTNYLQSVTFTGPGRSRWKTQGLMGRSVEWEAEIVEDRPNELISWRSVEGSGIDSEGSVRFVPAPGDRGTEIHVQIRYEPPGGVVGTTMAKLFGRSAEQQVWEDLRRFKQVMETGEVTESEATKGGRRFRRRPGEPMAA